MSQNELIPYQDIEKMGKAVAESSLFGIKTQQQAIALMLVAQALGKHPALAAMEYNIIQGRPAKKADAMLIDFQSSGGKLEWHELTDLKADATFSHPQGGSLRLTWDIDRAKKAGLYDKDGSMYKKYPRSMLRARLVADGVRAVYPAATGGMLSKEEAEDIIDIQADSNKSRVEQIIDAEHEVKEDEPKAEKEQPKEQKKTTKKEDSKSNSQSTTGPAISDELPNGHKIIVGLVEEIPKVATVEKDGKPAVKHSFKIGDLRYGTFDTDMSKKIMECIDKRIMVKFEFTERKSGDKIFNDIVKFSQAVAEKDVPI